MNIIFIKDLKFVNGIFDETYIFMYTRLWGINNAGWRYFN